MNLEQNTQEVQQAIDCSNPTICGRCHALPGPVLLERSGVWARSPAKADEYSRTSEVKK